MLDTLMDKPHDAADEDHPEEVHTDLPKSHSAHNSNDQHTKIKHQVGKPSASVKVHITSNANQAPPT